jgi:hypothetical protein
MKALNRIFKLMGLSLVVAAIADQISRPKAERTWQGKVAGFVPYDFRKPTLARIRERWWNPDDPRLFTPHAFGVGWAINLHQLMRTCLPSEDEEQRAA